MTPEDDYHIAFQHMMKFVLDRISKMDLSSLKDGEVRNVNEILVDRKNDFGVDRNKNLYLFTGGNWKEINSYIKHITDNIKK